MKTIDFFHRYGRVVDVPVHSFTYQIERAIDDGWLTKAQGLSMIEAAANSVATTVSRWDENTPIGYLSTDTDNPLADLESPCAKIARMLSDLNDEDTPRVKDFPRTPQGEGQRVST